MGIGCPHPFLGQLIHMRCFYFGFGIKKGDIPIAQIVGKDDHDIGLTSLLSSEAYQPACSDEKAKQ